MRARHFLQHNGIGGLICKKRSDLVHAIIAAPQIESDDAKRALAAGCGLWRGVLHRHDRKPQIDGKERRSGRNQSKIAGEECKHEQEKRAGN